MRRGAGGRARPRVSIGLEAPAPFGGILADVVRRRARIVRLRRGAVSGASAARCRSSFADWLTGTPRWEMGLRERALAAMVRRPVLLAGAAVSDARRSVRRSDAASGVWSHRGAELDWRRPASNGDRGPGPKATSCSARAARQPRAVAGTPLLSWGGAGIRPGPRRTAARAPAAPRRRDRATRCSAAGLRQRRRSSGGGGARRSSACCESRRRSSSTSRAPTTCRAFARSSCPRRRRRGPASRDARRRRAARRRRRGLRDREDGQSRSGGCARLRQIASSKLQIPTTPNGQIPNEISRF